MGEHAGITLPLGPYRYSDTEYEDGPLGADWYSNGVFNPLVPGIDIDNLPVVDVSDTTTNVLAIMTTSAKMQTTAKMTSSSNANQPFTPAYQNLITGIRTYISSKYDVKESPSLGMEWSTQDTAVLCLSSLHVLLLALATIGFVLNFLAYVRSAMKSKSDRHFHNFLHIFLSSMLFLIPTPFIAFARQGGSWNYGEITYKVLSVVASTGFANCSFQIAYLAVIRGGEAIDSTMKPTTGWRKVVCYALWIVAIALSSPAAEFGVSFLEGSLPGLAETPRPQKVYIYNGIKVAVNYAFPCLVSTLSLLLSNSSCMEISGPDDRKKSVKDVRGVREVAFQSILFFVCYLPYQVGMIVIQSRNTLPDCDTIPDVLLSVGLLFHILMPMSHLICLQGKRPKTSRDVSTLDGRKHLLDANSNTTTPLKIQELQIA